MIPTTYELDEYGEACGIVYHYCSNTCQDEHARVLWQGGCIRSHVTAEPDENVRVDMCDGEVCANCEATL